MFTSCFGKKEIFAKFVQIFLALEALENVEEERKKIFRSKMKYFLKCDFYGVCL